MADLDKMSFEMLESVRTNPLTGLRQLNICATRRSYVRHVCVP